MYEAIGLTCMIVFIASCVWFLISVFRLLVGKWRRSAIRHLKISVPLLVVAFIAGIYGIMSVYKDYGLTSREGLAEAKAAYQAKRQADSAADKAKKQQDKLMEQEREEAAAKAAAEADLKEKCSDKSMAFTMGTELVKRQLKAPSTAEFPSFGDELVSVSTKPNCAFRVLGWVDAQNAFGAQLRTTYTLDLIFLPDENKWQLTDLQMK